MPDTRDNLVIMPKESALFANIRLHSTSQCFRKRLKSITKKFLNMRRKENTVKKNLTKKGCCVYKKPFKR